MLAAEVARYTPWFAYLLGIRPWEMDRLTHADYLRCKTLIDHLRQSQGVPGGQQ